MARQVLIAAAAMSASSVSVVSNALRSPGKRKCDMDGVELALLLDSRSRVHSFFALISSQTPQERSRRNEMMGMHFLSFGDDRTAQRSWRVLSRRALRAIAFSPPVRTWLQARYEQHFATAERAHLFRGVYGSFDEAARAAPDSKPIGYDNPEPASMYRDLLDTVHLSDYPVLFWLARAIGPRTKRLFDFGGHVGTRYYSFRARLALPESFVWQVMDVPAVVQAGRKLASEKEATNLTFTDRREDLGGADILFATGSLQYLEKPLHEILAPIPDRPAHVIINQLPMHDGAAYYTLQSIGAAFCPYRIEDHPGLVAGMAALGYEKLDAWRTPEKLCPIPFHPEHSVRGYEGMYFRARP